MSFNSFASRYRPSSALLSILVCAGAMAHGATYYVAIDGNDASAGTTRETPFLTVGHALSVAADGDTVSVGEGEHMVSATLDVSKAVVIHGAGKDKTTLRASAAGYRLVLLQDEEAVLRGVTVAGARPKTYGMYGAGILIQDPGGMVVDCRVTDNQSTATECRGGGVALDSEKAVLSRCVIEGNRADNGPAAIGGGVYVRRGLVENCLIRGNLATSGGGLGFSNYNGAGGRVLHCTIVENETETFGGGVYFEVRDKMKGCFQNNLVCGNKALGDNRKGTPEWSVSQDSPDSWKRLEAIVFSSFFGSAVPAGMNSISGNPAFVDQGRGDFHFLPGAPCIDAGTPPIEEVACDLDGNPRENGVEVDIGCYEFDSKAVTCGFTATPEALFEGGSVRLAPSVYGVPGDADFACRWRVKDSTGTAVVCESEERSPVFTFPEAGRYDVELVVTDGTGRQSSLLRPAYLHVAAAEVYLAPAGASSPAYPWKTPETAANDLHQLVAEAIDGSTIRVAEGEYALTNELQVFRGVRIIGSSRDKTILKSAAPARSQGFRMIYMSHPDALLQRVTVTGGVMTSYGGYGSGVYLSGKGGTVADCRITGNGAAATQTKGGGVCLNSPDARVLRCVIDDNEANNADYAQGGGVCLMAGLVENCLIRDNRASKGGGLYVREQGVVRNCTIVGNRASKLGGGVYWGSSSKEGVGLVNLIVAGNEAANDPGEGAPGWALDKENERQAMEGAFSYSLFGDGVPAIGPGSFSASPSFADEAGGDYRLRAGSAAIDAGVACEGADRIDLQGNDRLQNGRVDIGCLEFDTSTFSCGFDAPTRVFFENEGPVSLFAAVYGVPADAELDYRWTVSSKQGHRYKLTGENPSFVITEAGRYDVELTVADSARGAQVTEKREAFLHVASRTACLAPSGTSTPSYPWNTPETAANDICEVVGEAIDGMTIFIAKGDYPVTNEVVVTAALRLLGAGIDESVFHPATSGMTTRLFTLNHPGSLLHGVTVKGARHKGSYWDFGDGVLIAPRGGTVRLCRVTGCSSYASFHHRGALGVQSEKGVISRCIVDCNTNQVNSEPSSAGIGLTRGIVENCLVYGNVVTHGTGGLFLGQQSAGVVRNCTFADNLSLGASTYANGAGVLAWNPSRTMQVVNCIFARNEARGVTTHGPGWPEWHMHGSDSSFVFRNCLVGDAPPLGADAVVGDPLFKDPSKGDYRIARLSPAHDAGLFEAWMTNAVDLAGAPRVDHKELVDIGCYEAAFVPRGTMLLLR